MIEKLTGIPGDPTQVSSHHIHKKISRMMLNYFFDLFEKNIGKNDHVYLSDKLVGLIQVKICRAYTAHDSAGVHDHAPTQCGKYCQRKSNKNESKLIIIFFSHIS